MAYEFYVTIEGAKQGKFKGQGAPVARKDKWISGLNFEYQVQSPRDAATGQATGRRQWEPIHILKEWGAASPRLYQALTTNEILDDVTIEFVKTSGGNEHIYYTVKLTNARVVDFDWQKLNKIVTFEYTDVETDGHAPDPSFVSKLGPPGA